MPRLNASGGQNYTITLDSMSLGKAHLVNGELEQQFGFSVSLSVLFRRAINKYYDFLLAGEISREEFHEICRAADRDPADVIKGLRKRTGRNPVSGDEHMTGKNK